MIVIRTSVSISRTSERLTVQSKYTKYYLHAVMIPYTFVDFVGCKIYKLPSSIKNFENVKDIQFYQIEPC